ncbi:MAG: sigma-70 family RNA polymerase sigma factor [Desulfobacterales bacterium]|nr:sigma-70 family RNA polymerase sigma factor [Desulfobacterales bacterium]
MIFSTPYREKTDADLMTRIPQGDKKAFKEILSRYQGGVYGFALSLLRDPQEAEDISQEVFLRLYKTASSYRSSATLKTYIFRITRNLCIDYHRKKRPQAMPDPPEPVCAHTPYHQLYASELRDRIDAIISDLPGNQRAAIHLRHVHGMSYREIADTLGVTVQAVESLLTRARRTFRDRFDS